MREVGWVTPQLQAVLPILVGSPDGPPERIETVLDTGFGGFLALPALVIDQLCLPFVDIATVRPADGVLMQCAEHLARVQWFGGLAEIPVLAMEGGPLLGMGLLRGCRVSFEVTPRAVVEISAR